MAPARSPVLSKKAERSTVSAVPVAAYTAPRWLAEKNESMTTADVPALSRCSADPWLKDTALPVNEQALNVGVAALWARTA
jgi:hypothetical protein